LEKQASKQIPMGLFSEAKAMDIHIFCRIISPLKAFQEMEN